MGTTGIRRVVGAGFVLVGHALAAAACAGPEGTSSVDQGTSSADQGTPSAGQRTPSAGQGIPPADPWIGPGTSGFVDTPDGERIHVVTAGERGSAGAPALLFVPGWTMTAEIWEPQMDHFSASHRVAAMDPRSQGRSSKARDGHHAAARAGDIRTVVEHFDLEPVVLVGWSMAVTEVVAYVDRYGTDGIAGLVLVDGVAGQDWEPGTAAMFMEWTADFIHDRGAATDAFVRGMYRSPQSEEYLRAVTDHSLRTPTDAAAALIIGTARSDFREALPAIDRPVLVAVTTGSPWDRVYEEMAAAIPGATLEWFTGAGHALFVDEPGRFNALLEDFLQGAN